MNVVSRQTNATGRTLSRMVRRTGETVQTLAATVTGTGEVSATVVLEGYDPASGVFYPIATLTLSGTGSASDSVTGISAFLELGDNVTAISGTNAVVTVSLMGA